MEDIDQIIEEEVKIVENKILENTKEVDATEPQSRQSSKKTKLEIMEDINKLERAAGFEETPNSKLRRLTKPELMKLLGEIINKSTGEIQPAKDDKFFVPASEIEQKKEESRAQSLNDMAASMCQFNMILVSVLEGISESFKSKTDGIALLGGWSDNVRKMTPELKMVFAEMIRKYGTSVARFTDPLITYAVLMGGTAGDVLITNINKKKKDTN